MKKLLCLLAILAALFPASALADDGSLGGTGETVYPLKNADIAMQREAIDIRVGEGMSRVTCRFYFKNTGKDAKVLMGFPSFYDSFKLPDGGAYTKEERGGDISLYRFRTYINGRRIPVAKKKGMPQTEYNQGGDYYPVWYTWNLRFKRSQALKVENTYRCRNFGISDGSEGARYILKTGALWKGVIGKIDIRMAIDHTDPSCLSLQEDDLMPDYCTEGGVLVWSKRGFEPDRDISVYFNRLDLSWYDINGDYAETGPESGTEAAAWDRSFIKDLYRMERHFQQKHYRSAVWWGDRIVRLHGKKQTKLFHYYMGVACYNRRLYQKAVAELDQCGEYGLCHKALALKKMGKAKEYRELLYTMAGMQNSGLALWVNSRLKDMGEKI